LRFYELEIFVVEFVL